MVDEGAEGKPAKKGRSKTGCSTCRARKVRCDERPGTCEQCERLGLPCAYAGSATSTSPDTAGDAQNRGVSQSPATAGVKRKRTFRSCEECRATKTRCSGEKPMCVRCAQKGLTCNYNDASEPAWQQYLRLKAAADSDIDNTSPASREHPPGWTASPEQANQENQLTVHRPAEDQWWLASPRLPEGDDLRVLVEYYFANVHPLRCFGFLHKPSFMQRLDAGNGRQRDDDALLLIVCALGAMFYAAEHRTPTEPPSTTRKAGSQWANRAQQLVLGQLGNIMVENLMTTVLLHDYRLRLSNFGDAFMLSGITARMMQALQINLEHSTDILCENSSSGPSASTKESRRRLMWSCYILDSLIGNGIDQLTLIKDEDIKVQLPCNERNFLLQTACITEVLQRGQFLKFIDLNRLPAHPGDNIGIRAYYIRFIAIRRKVLKYIKHLNVMRSPWLADSEFAHLVGAAHAWFNSLPDSLQFTPTAMYIRKETQQLGALFSLHALYHQTMCDLYRICAPSLYKLRYFFTYPMEQQGFLHGLQRELFGYARNLALIAAEALRHGPHAMADCWTPTVLYDCCRVLLYHATQLVEPPSDRSRFLMLETIPLVRSNVKALKMMQAMYAVAELLGNAAERMLEKVEVGSEAIISGQSIIPDEPYPNNENDAGEGSEPGTPVQSAPDYVLNPLSIYRMTRKGIPEKHMPEKERKPVSPTATTSNRSTLQRRSTLQHVPFERAFVDTEAGPSDTAATVPAYGPAQSQAALDDLLSMFSSDPSGWTWNPGETAMGSQYESGGLPPWEPTYVDQQLDAWVPMFSGASTQQYRYPS